MAASLSTDSTAARISLRLGQTTINKAESRLRRELTEVEAKLARRAHARPLFRDCAARYLAQARTLQRSPLTVTPTAPIYRSLRTPKHFWERLARRLRSTERLVLDGGSDVSRSSDRCLQLVSRSLEHGKLPPRRR